MTPRRFLFAGLLLTLVACDPYVRPEKIADAVAEGDERRIGRMDHKLHRYHNNFGAESQPLYEHAELHVRAVDYWLSEAEQGFASLLVERVYEPLTDAQRERLAAIQAGVREREAEAMTERYRRQRAHDCRMYEIQAQRAINSNPYGSGDARPPSVDGC